MMLLVTFCLSLLVTVTSTIISDANEENDQYKGDRLLRQKDDDHVVKTFFENGGKVEIILFYGRRRYTKVQLPYLLQNRKTDEHPGKPHIPLVSKINVMLNTNVTEDIEYIRSVAAKEPEYFRIHDNVYGLNFCRFYPRFNESNTMYIKMDDDIVYIHQSAIFHMVKMKLTTTFMFISANIINHSALSKYHIRTGAYSFQQINEEWVYQNKIGNPDVHHTPHGSPVFDGDAWGDHTWRSGPHAFLQHMMFFHFKRRRDIEAFDIGYTDLDKERYYRWSINCFLFETRDMKLFELAKCGSNDELYLSMFLPHDAGDHSGVCGSAIMCHFAYTPQRKFLEENTTTLRRYEELSLSLGAGHGNGSTHAHTHAHGGGKGHGAKRSSLRGKHLL